MPHLQKGHKGWSPIQLLRPICRDGLSSSSNLGTPFMLKSKNCGHYLLEGKGVGEGTV